MITVYAQSIQRRFSRWMHNPWIHPTYLYEPLITWALSEWIDKTIYLSFDLTMLWNRLLCNALECDLPRLSDSSHLAGVRAWQQ
jgi:hypothetical protein